MATPLIPITLAWLIGLWLASRVALPSLVLGVAAIVAAVGTVFTWRSPKPHREYLARQGVYSIMSRPRVSVLARAQGFAPLGWLYAFKARAKSVVAQILPEPQAALLTGILLGDDSGITHSVQDAFRATGTSHIIAISG